MSVRLALFVRRRHILADFGTKILKALVVTVVKKRAPNFRGWN